MDSAQPSNDIWFGRERGRQIDEINEVKQADSGDQTAELQGHKNDENVDAEVNRPSEENVNNVRFQPFFKAVQNKDWKGIGDIISKDPEVLTIKIKGKAEETFLHIITRYSDAPFWLMEKIASKVSPESLESLAGETGRSVLFQAAAYGNRKAAKAFVRRNKDLPNMRNSKDLLPIHLAAQYGHKEMTQYLLSVTRGPLDDQYGVPMLQYLIGSDLYGIALELLKRYPNLSRRPEDRGHILQVLASKPSAFESGSRFGYWQRLIYHWIPVQEEQFPRPESVDGDVENPIERSNKLKEFTHLGSILREISTAFGALSQKLHIMLWNPLMQLAPSVKCIYDTKLTHRQTLQIVRIMCHEGIVWSHKEARNSLRMPVLKATRLGIGELVREIVKAFYYSYTFIDKMNYGLLELAILHRQEKVFNIINRTYCFLWDWEVAHLSENTDNLLHLAGRLAPSSQVPGAALQMQRELQWFKVVETLVNPSLQEQRNHLDKTPREVLTEEHKNLVIEGEKWMKDTASSCSVAAALIITVVFAAAFTVPGGNDCDEGIPVFLHKSSFIIFVISDALALFSSSASLLMFLGILTSRYAEEDFLLSLPLKLIIGLITLFFSIAMMMVAFGAAIYTFLSHSWKWTIIPISLLGCLPVTLFAWLQFPLLVEIFLSTYRPSIYEAINVFAGIPVQEEQFPRPESVDGDVENPIERSNKLKEFTHLGSILRQISTAFGALSQKLHIMLWNPLMQLAPSLKCIYDAKLTHGQTLQI